MGFFNWIYHLFVKKETLEQTIDLKFKSLGSLRYNLRSINNKKISSFMFTSLLVVGFLGATIYLAYSAKVNAQDVKLSHILISFGMTIACILLQILLSKYFSYSSASYLTKVQAQEEEIKALLKRAMNELPYKAVNDLLKKYDYDKIIMNEFKFPSADSRDSRDSRDNRDRGRRAAPGSNEREKKREKKKPSNNLPYPTFSNRTIADKIVDKLIGDSPQNRSALVCSKCSTHNGLMPPNSNFPFIYTCYNCKFKNSISQVGDNSNSSIKPVIESPEKSTEEKPEKFSEVSTEKPKDEALEDSNEENSHSE